MIRLVIFVVLMMFWLLFGCYIAWEPARPALVLGSLIPWACVAILGWCVFKGVAQPK